MNAKILLVVNLLSIPSLLFHSAEAFPVATKIIDDFDWFIFKVMNYLIVSGCSSFENVTTKEHLGDILYKGVLEYYNCHHDQHWD